MTYTLRSGVTWHDGKPFTADDVVFTFSLIADQGLSQYAQWLTDMTAIDAPDDATVRRHLSSARRRSTLALAIPILPQAHLGGDEQRRRSRSSRTTHPVGTGPFTFGEWKHGQTVSVDRNDSFWGTAAGASTVIWVLYQNEDVMAQGLQAGEVDILPEVPPTIWDGLSDAEDVKPLSLPGFSFHHIGMNVSDSSTSGGNPLLLDRNVRQALSLRRGPQPARPDRARRATAQPGSVLLPPAMGDFQLQIAAADQLNANADQAKQLLDQAGLRAGRRRCARERRRAAPLEFRLIAIESTTVDVRAAQLFRERGGGGRRSSSTSTTMDENTLGLHRLQRATRPTGTSSCGAGTRA